MPIRTRIAPSPTGYMHIGTLRTALFDYLMARQHGGQFIIRIEDTDQSRSVPGAVESLLSTFQKLGLEHDEGPVLLPDGTLTQKGAYGPYIQSERLPIYREHLQKLIDAGHAYYCFCTKDRLDQMRKEQQATKQNPKYDRTCLRLSSEEVADRLARSEAHVVRLKVPEGKSSFTDAIRGFVEFDNRDVDDQVLMKSDGFPTYHLAVVIDDELMKITHVFRGEEWLSSTPKHLILYEMFGFEKPVFAHVPLLLNPDRSKLSKRQGDVAVEDYLKRGYLPQTILNFVGTLGFNPKADQEIYSMTELIALFDLSRVNSSGAVLNMEKLDWMNNHYLRQLPLDELSEAARPFLQADVESDLVRRAMLVERERVNRLDELQARIDPYLVLPAYDASVLVWKKADAADAKMQLTDVRMFINDQPEAIFVSPATLEAAIRSFLDAGKRQNGNVLWPLRVALSGKEKSATPFELFWALGREEGMRRIDSAIAKLVV